MEFQVTHAEETRQPSGLHGVSSEELNLINRYADKVQNAAKYYADNIAEKTIHFIYADQDKELNDMEVVFSKDNFVDLVGLHLDGKDTSQTLEDFASGNGEQNDIFIGQKDDIESKLSEIDKLPDFFNANKVTINSNVNVEQVQREKFTDIIQTQDKNSIPALKEFSPKVIRPYSLINTAVRNNYKDVPDNAILAVVRENDPNNSRDLDILSANQTYLQDSEKINDLKDMVSNGIERKKALENSQTNKVTNMAKQLGLRKIPRLKFNENDSLYQKTQKLAKFIYKNGEWTEDDVREAAVKKAQDIMVGDNPVVSVEKISLSDRQIPEYFETEELKANGIAKVYRLGWEVGGGDIFNQNVFIDPNNRSSARHGKRFRSPRIFRNPFNGEIVKEKNRIRKGYRYTNEGIIFNQDRLVGSVQFEKVLLDEFDRQQNKLDFSKGTFTYYLDILFDPKMAGKKNEHYFKKGGYGYSFYEKEAKFIDDYINAVYDVSVQHDYEKKLDKQERANAFITKANINESTKKAMDSTSLKKDFKYVELDNEVDLNEFHKFEGEMSKIQNVLPKVTDRKPELRLRKLGNYRSLGLYTPASDSIVLDFRSSEKQVNGGYNPSGTGIQSFVHEYGHFLDYKYSNNQDNGNIFNTLSLQDNFKPIIDKYTEQLKKNGIYNVKHGDIDHYFAIPTEIFARAFEIYSSNQGLESSLIQDRNQYFTQPEYLSYTPEIRDMITQYFDSTFPDYAQKIKEFAQTKSENIEINNNHEVEESEQQSLDLSPDIQEEQGKLDDEIQNTKIEVESELEKKLDESADNLIDTLKKENEEKVDEKQEESKQNSEEKNQETEPTIEVEDRDNEINPEEEKVDQELDSDGNSTDEEPDSTENETKQEKEEKKRQEDEKEVAEVIKGINAADDVEKVVEDLEEDVEKAGIISGLVDDVENLENTEKKTDEEKIVSPDNQENEVELSKNNTVVPTDKKQDNMKNIPRKLTTEIINKAKEQDVLAVAQNLGIELIRSKKGTYRWADEPTFEINPKTKLFNWTDKDLYNQGVIKLVEAKKDFSYREAVVYLNDTDIADFDFNKVSIELNNGEIKAVSNDQDTQKQTDQNPKTPKSNEKVENKSTESTNEDNTTTKKVAKNNEKIPRKVSAKQIKNARERNILEVAQNLGMDLIKEGRTYRWKEHDSLVIFPENNTYSWFSLNKMGQNAIDLAKDVGGMDFKSAVVYLNSDDLSKFDENKLAANEPQKPFVNMLKQNRSNDHLRSYLMNQRKLSQTTINDFLDQGVIYQANYKTDGVYEPVIVFKHNDMDSKNVGASVQGTRLDNKRYGKHGYVKKIIPNSKSNYGITFNSGLKANDTTHKMVFFEAPIDMMSYYELNKDKLDGTRLVAMNGLKERTIANHFVESAGFGDKATLEKINQQFIDNGLTPKEAKQRFIDQGWSIKLAVDNDDKGRKFIEKVRAKYPMIPFEAEVPPLLEGKEKTDWNDYLKASKANTLELAKKQPQIKEVQVADGKEKSKSNKETKKGVVNKVEKNIDKQQETVPNKEIPTTEKTSDKDQNVVSESAEFNYDKAKAKELSNHAVAVIKDIVKDPQKLDEYMDMLGNFPEYSPRNVALIYDQAKAKGIEVSKLGDYNKWLENHDTYKLTKDDITYNEEIAQKMKENGKEYEQKLSVRAGEKGKITLFRQANEKFIPKTDENGNIVTDENGKTQLKKYQPSKLTDTEKQLLADGKIEITNTPAKDKHNRAIYKTYKVFDISQTTLKPKSYMKLVDKHHYDYPNDKSKLYKFNYGLKNYAKERGIVYGIDKENQFNLSPNTRGKYFDYRGTPVVAMNNNVTKNSGFEDSLAVGVRLLSHATLHTTKINANEVPRTVQGLEAEIMGHTVASHYGLKTEKRWLKEMSEELQKLDDMTLAKTFGKAQNSGRDLIKGIAKYTDNPKRNRNHGRKNHKGINQKLNAATTKAKKKFGRNFGFGRPTNPGFNM